jgi:hypothetical protein
VKKLRIETARLQFSGVKARGKRYGSGLEADQMFLPLNALS